MGDSSGNNGFHSRAEVLLDSRKFSDVEIEVIDGKTKKTFQAHKLILAMSSPKFADMFYNSDSPKVFKILNYPPHIVYLMLKYVYAKKIFLTTIEEARQLYSFSKDFKIRSLQEFCVNFVSKEELNEDNVLPMYECALNEKFTALLAMCRNVVSTNTKAVFESPTFVETPSPVVKDIFRLENLTVESELDVLKAAIKWVKHSCKRDKLSDNFNHLRQFLYPLLPYLRLLSLKIEEYSDFVENYNILTAYESSLITRMLLGQNVPVPLPKHLCVETRPRQNSGCISRIEESQIKPVSFPISKTETLQSGTGDASSKYGTPSYFSEIELLSRENIINQQRHIPKHEFFEFPLYETKKLFSTAFNNDVKCGITIKLLKGIIVIYGIEIKINDESKREETFEVYCNISNRDSYKASTHTEKLQNSVLKLCFNPPLEVFEDNPVQIEIMIEDLKLNRCSIIKNLCYELKYESNVIANLLLTSNQVNKTEENFYLISRFIYSVN